MWGSRAGAAHACRVLPECQPLLHLAQEASVELVDGVYVGEEQGHQLCRHGVLLDHRTAEPLQEELRVTEEPRPRWSVAIAHTAPIPDSPLFKSVLQLSSWLITQFSQHTKTVLGEKLQMDTSFTKKLGLTILTLFLDRLEGKHV